ncbi:hypothetical protein Tco_0086962 [Tanacetum coccineum]
MANEVWDLIEGTSISKETDIKKDSSASAYLFQGLPEDLQMQVAGCETAKEIWDSLKSRFIGTEDVQQAHSQQLKSKFKKLVMKEDESINSFAGKMMSIITKAATCGLTFDEQTKVRKSQFDKSKRKERAREREIREKERERERAKEKEREEGETRERQTI